MHFDAIRESRIETTCSSTIMPSAVESKSREYENGEYFFFELITSLFTDRRF